MAEQSITPVLIYEDANGEIQSFTPQTTTDPMTGEVLPYTRQNIQESLQLTHTAEMRRIAEESGADEAALYAIQHVSSVLPPKPEPQRPPISMSTVTVNTPKTQTVTVHTYDPYPMSDEYKQQAMSTMPQPTLSASSGEDEDPKAQTYLGAAISASLIANTINGKGWYNTKTRTDEELKDFYREYARITGKLPATDEAATIFVKAVRDYKPNTMYPAPIDIPETTVKEMEKRRASSVLKYGINNPNRVAFWQDRGVNVSAVTTEKSYSDMELGRAIEFFENPTQHLKTHLTDKEEKSYQKWFKQLKDDGKILETEDGRNYDFRGAFKDGVEPVIQSDNTYHWPDKYKKPNHPTFSTDSMYAKGQWQAYAGTWQKDGSYRAPQIMYPYAEQEKYLENVELATKPYEIDKDAYDVWEIKNRRRFLFFNNFSVKRKR